MVEPCSICQQATPGPTVATKDGQRVHIECADRQALSRNHTLQTEAIWHLAAILGIDALTLLIAQPIWSRLITLAIMAQIIGYPLLHRRYLLLVYRTWILTALMRLVFMCRKGTL